MLRYLWSNRLRPPLFSWLWIRNWTKRFFTLPRLIESVCRQSWLRARGAQIETPVFMAGCVLNGSPGKLVVRAGTFLGRITLHLHDKIEIGRNVVINDGAVLLTASHDVSSNFFAGITKPIAIGDYAWIATGAVVLPGIVIGRGAVIAAGAVVTKSVPDFAIACGNPARILNRERIRGLNYSPVRLVAAFSAWLGAEPLRSA